MKLKIKLFTLLLLLASVHAGAVNFKGGDLSYQWLRDSTWQFTLSLYGPCAGGVLPQPTTALCYFNTCNNQGGQLILSGLTTSQPDLPAFQHYQYTGTVTLPSRCNTWTFYTALASRDTSINLQSGTANNIYLEATLDNQNVQNNSSPVFYNPPVPLLNYNQTQTLWLNASDVNNDGLVYELIQPRTAAATYTNPAACQNGYAANDVPFVSGNFTLLNNPFPTNNSYLLDPLTGMQRFTPSDSGIVTYAIRIREYNRNGTLTGTVMREIQSEVTALASATFGPVQHSFFNNFGFGQFTQSSFGVSADAYANVPVGLCFSARRAGGAGTHLLLSSNAQFSCPRAIESLIRQGTDSPTLCITWTPALSDTGLHALTFTATDSFPQPDCRRGYPPVIAQTYTVYMNVKSSTTVEGTVVELPVSVYPNPAGRQLSIHSKLPVTSTLTDYTGKLVLQSNKQELDLTGMANGVYLLHVYNESGLLLKKQLITKSSSN